MKLRIVLASAAAVAAAAVSVVVAQTATAAPSKVTDVNFAGTVALSNCSGSVVKLTTSAPDDPALVLSNGHCLEEGFPSAGEVITNEPSSRSFTLLDATANGIGTLHATKIVYATMTGTDVSLYQLDQTYAEIQSQYGIDALTLSDQHPTAGTAMTVVSGYWQQTYSCSIDGFVHELHEGDWVFTDSIRYTPECETIGGTSGSPIEDTATGTVIGINNTGNEDGGQCTINNPCEVDEAGNVTVHQGTNYGQQIYLFYGCLTAGSEIDLNQAGCQLAKPAA
jgi:V8-like Glu-specific endopeptidase